MALASSITRRTDSLISGRFINAALVVMTGSGVLSAIISESLGKERARVQGRISKRERGRGQIKSLKDLSSNDPRRRCLTLDVSAAFGVDILEPGDLV